MEKFTIKEYFDILFTIQKYFAYYSWFKDGFSYNDL